VRFASLISLALLIAAPASAEVAFSGFAYGTWFSQTDWHDHEYRAAVNMDATHGDFAVRGQLTTQGQQPRRLSLEYSRPVTQDTSVTGQIGRLVRLEGFYNNVTDAPSSSGMSVLPLATYNRRMNTGTFTIMDGIHVVGRTRLDANQIEYGARWGKTFIESDFDVQKEAFGRVVSDGIAIDPQFDSFDLYARLEKPRSSYLVSLNHYAADVVSTKGKPMDEFIVNTMSASVEYSTLKFGAMHRYDRLYVSGEYHYGITNTYNKAGAETFEKKAHSGYLRVGYDLRDCVEVYAVQNYGRTVDSPSRASSTALGATWDRGDWMVNAEYHKGSSTGSAWTKYDSDTRTWDALAVSVVRRF
jgi:hypothetical protein